MRIQPCSARSAVLLPALALFVACSGQPDATPRNPATTFALPTVPLETIPPGFVFPVPVPLTAGNADIHAQRALFQRTGSMCFRHMDVDGGYSGDFDGMAAELEGEIGLLEDGRSFLGPLDESLRALDLEPIGIVAGDVAYGIGLVKQDRAMPQLPLARYGRRGSSASNSPTAARAGA